MKPTDMDEKDDKDNPDRDPGGEAFPRFQGTLIPSLSIQSPAEASRPTSLATRPKRLREPDSFGETKSA